MMQQKNWNTIFYLGIGDGSRGGRRNNRRREQEKHDIEGTVAVDNKRDIVLLSVSDAKAPALILGDSNKVTVGDEVYAIGNPQGLEGTFSQGIISGIREIGSDSLLQLTAPISPGSSGGPVLNSQGEVVGIAVATFKDGQNLNLAIPSLYLSDLLSEIKPVTPLSGEIKLGKKESIFDDLGGRSTEGVIGTLFKWKYSFAEGDYTFSLRNKLREPVKNIYYVVTFYANDGEPIDFAVGIYNEVIPGGLAKRMPEDSVHKSVQELTGTSSRNVEIRILNFEIIQ